jgi:hypothetical protein
MRRETIIGTLITGVALIVAILHNFFPGVRIDALTFGLLLLAAFPWLTHIIKSIDLPGIGKIELQEIRRQAEEARGAAISASQKAELALAGTTTATGNDMTPSLKLAEEQILHLANEYNNIRETQSSGPSRTSAMTGVVSRMIATADKLQNFRVEKWLAETDRGKRLSAYVYLYTRPDYSQLDNLIDSVCRIEDKPFGQYWGIQAIEKVLGRRENQKVSLRVLQKLREFFHQLPTGTDRYYEMTRILSALKKDDIGESLADTAHA